MGEEQKSEKRYRKEPESIINEHIGYSMIAGAIPIPLVDIAAVTAIQLDMIHQLTNYYEIDFNDELGKSLVTTTVGASLGSILGRAGASLVKGIPGVGTVLGIGSQVVVSGASTYAIGHLFNNHFKANGTLSDVNIETMKDGFKDLFNVGKDFVGKRQKSESSEDKLKTLAKLKELKESGAITEEEYNETKKNILSSL